ncbi:DUF2254 family protein [Anaerotalea alkaliphila]|uniref:DUF2254 domain-containing protein n=1 Tax=Anaerotalea alkaliphila TaxID=2662126 RepID=A0A7X5KMU0_9FIRM|nr:DUF2254 family protein [Anaerotalea alkaliphila]NDL67053.1 DUF2254 domain-containing protein [Anaerotalea alkaliphila]
MEPELRRKGRAMLTISFSTMMVVLTIYGGQFSPRTLQDFLEKRMTQRILGYFMGVLVFSIFALFSMKPERLSAPVLKCYAEDEEKVRLVLRGLTFDRLLFENFYPIRHYGVEDLFILDGMAGALAVVAKENTPKIRRKTWNFAKYLLSGVDWDKLQDVERSYLKDRFYQLAVLAGELEDYGKMFGKVGKEER